MFILYCSVFYQHFAHRNTFSWLNNSSLLLFCISQNHLAALPRWLLVCCLKYLSQSFPTRSADSSSSLFQKQVSALSFQRKVSRIFTIRPGTVSFPLGPNTMSKTSQTKIGLFLQQCLPVEYKQNDNDNNDQDKDQGCHSSSQHCVHKVFIKCSIVDNISFCDCCVISDPGSCLFSCLRVRNTQKV